HTTLFRSRTQAAQERPSGHAHGAVAVRTRLHHLYAHRLLGTVGPGHRGRTEAGDRTLRTRIRAPVAAPVREQAEVRAGGPRGDPPAGDSFRTPAQVSKQLSGDEFRLYDLIWKRTVASQMADAKGKTATIKVSAALADGHEAGFSASGTVITFRGFLAAYEEGQDASRYDTKSGESRLPQVEE